MVLNLVVIGLGIALEPFPLTAFILLLSSGKGTLKGLAFVLGWLACLVVVVVAVVLTTQGKPPAPGTAPSTAALAVKLALGVALVLYAWRRWRRIGAPRKPPTLMARLDGMSLWAAAGLAAFLQPWALVAAGRRDHHPGQTVRAGRLPDPGPVRPAGDGQLPVPRAVRDLAPASAGVRLQALRTWLDTHSDQVIILLSLLLGCWLVGNSLYYLA